MSRILYPENRHRSRKKRMPKRILLLVAGVVLIFSAVGGIAYSVRMPQWQIRNINIAGASALDAGSLQAAAAHALEGHRALILPRASYFLASTALVEETLRGAFPRIGEASAVKQFPDIMNIEVRERELFANFCSAAGCAYIDKTGFAYEEAPRSEGSIIMKIKKDIPAIAVGETALDSGTLAFMTFLSDMIRGETGLEVIEYELLSAVPSEIRVRVSDGFSLVMKREDDFANAMRVLKTVLDEEIKDRRQNLDYIDLRFGNKVFYKMRGGQ